MSVRERLSRAWLTQFRSDAEMRADVAKALHEAYQDVPWPAPTVSDVVHSSLDSVADNLLELAADGKTCEKADDCHAKAAVLRHLAAWIKEGMPV